MARCSYHPDIETGVTCTECGKPICPKEMVSTPVGYKCPEHARAERGQYVLVKPEQLVRAIAAGAAVGILGGVILGLLPWESPFFGIVWGSIVSEVVRRASGGHRGGAVGIVAAGSLGVGWLAGWIFYGVGFFTLVVAIGVALIQLAVIEMRW